MINKLTTEECEAAEDAVVAAVIESTPARRALYTSANRNAAVGQNHTSLAVVMALVCFCSSADFPPNSLLVPVEGSKRLDDCFRTSLDVCLLEE